MDNWHLKGIPAIKETISNFNFNKEGYKNKKGKKTTHAPKQVQLNFQYNDKTLGKVQV